MDSISQPLSCAANFLFILLLPSHDMLESDDLDILFFSRLVTTMNHNETEDLAVTAGDARHKWILAKWKRLRNSDDNSRSSAGSIKAAVGRALNEDTRRLLALSINHGVLEGSLAVFVSALPVMRVALGLTFLEIGTVLGLGLAATTLFQLIFGSLSDPQNLHMKSQQSFVLICFTAVVCQSYSRAVTLLEPNRVSGNVIRVSGSNAN